MIKCEVIEEFTFERFDQLKNIKRVNREQYGRLYVGDTFECTKDIAEYLTGGNAKKKVVVKVIEVIPNKQDAKIEENASKNEQDAKMQDIKPDTKIEEANVEEIVEKTKEIANQKSKKKKTSKK